MNHFVVGKETALESAKLFYGRNILNVVNIKILWPLLNHDHYNTGVKPGKLLQKLGLQLRIDNFSVPQPLESWDCRFDPPTNRRYLSSKRLFDPELRHELELLHEFSSLKELNVYTVEGPHRMVQTNPADTRYDPRGIAAQVTWLKKRDVKVIVRIGSCELEMNSEATNKDGKIWKDISPWFESPSEEDRPLYQQKHPGWQQEQSSAGGLEFSCLVQTSGCPRYGGRNCHADQEWHSGWYRTLIEDFIETERLMRANNELPECLGCEYADKTHGQEVTMSVCVGDDFLNEDKGNEEILDQHFNT